MSWTCLICRTDPTRDGLDEVIQMLRSCLNCKTNIGMQGHWSGDGLYAFRILAERFGADAVTAAWISGAAA